MAQCSAPEHGGVVSVRVGVLVLHGTSVCVCPCVCVRVSLGFLSLQAPHLLVIDVGQDASNDLQQKDDKEQDEVLGGGTGAQSGGAGHRHPRPMRIPSVQAQRSRTPNLRT